MSNRRGVGEWLLSGGDINITTSDKGYSLLHLAVLYGNFNLAELLIRAGIDMTVTHKVILQCSNRRFYWTPRDISMQSSLLQRVGSTALEMCDDDGFRLNDFERRMLQVSYD